MPHGAHSEKRAVYSWDEVPNTVACGVWVTRPACPPAQRSGVGPYSVVWGHHGRAMPGLSLFLLPRVRRTPATLHVAHPMGMLCKHRFRTQLQISASRLQNTSGVDGVTRWMWADDPQYFRSISEWKRACCTPSEATRQPRQVELWLSATLPRCKGIVRRFSEHN